MSTPRLERVAVSGVAVQAALACVVTLALGCASAPLRDHGVGITLDELRAGGPLGVTREPPGLVDDDAVLAVSDEMERFLSAHVARNADRSTRLRQLARAIVDEDRFGLQYDETTRTAAETFRTRRGNCLSFSNMFVAMARRVGLGVAYQEVDVPPDWSFRSDTFVLNRHVNAVVDLGGGGPRERLGSLVGSSANGSEHVVDFNMDDFKTTYDRRRISDTRALAHFYNNVAVERMLTDDVAAAVAYFRRATGHDPSFSPAWTNLGILYARKGHPDHAEAAYLQALRADGRDLVAMSDLASLYEHRGDRDRAAFYRERVADHRQRNPYFRFQLAREAFLAQDYDAAIRHLKYAVGRKRNEDQFCFLLGLSYVKKGDDRQARHWLSRAEEVAATDAMKRRYASKIEVLLSASPAEVRP